MSHWLGWIQVGAVSRRFRAATSWLFVRLALSGSGHPRERFIPDSGFDRVNLCANCTPIVKQ